MRSLSFPGAAEYIGTALNPEDPGQGLVKAVELVGEAPVRQVAERLASYNGRPVTEPLSASWCSGAPINPALAHLERLGQDAIMTALGARWLASNGLRQFSQPALASIQPAVKLLAGLPSAKEIEEFGAPA